MSDYLPYGKLNEGVEHVDICVSVALPKTWVKGCAVHLASDDNMDVVSVTLNENEKSFRKHEPEIINLSRHQEIDEILMV